METWTSYSYLQGTCADVIRHLFGSWETWLAEKSLNHYKMSQGLWCLKFFFLKKCIYFNLHLDEVYSSRWQEFQSICKKRQAFYPMRQQKAIVLVFLLTFLDNHVRKKCKPMRIPKPDIYKFIWKKSKNFPNRPFKHIRIESLRK